VNFATLEAEADADVLGFSGDGMGSLAPDVVNDIGNGDGDGMAPVVDGGQDDVEEDEIVIIYPEDDHESDEIDEDDHYCVEHNNSEDKGHDNSRHCSH
jgi:hypothetical protein